MAKAFRPRKRLDELFPFLQSLRTTSQPIPSLRTERLVRKIERELKRSLERAFEKAKLNIENAGDRDQLLVWLAWAVYGGKSPGAPRKWSPKKLRRLLHDVQALRASKPCLAETACCDLLSKGRAAEGRYKDFKSRTLRRLLQTAKRLNQQAKVLATPLNAIVTPDSINRADE
jgi:hypothetical protein